MNEVVDLDPKLCRLSGHPDAQAFLGYAFECQLQMVAARRIWADACRRMIQSIEFVPTFMIGEFVSRIEGEPFGYRIFTRLLCDEDEMVRCADAAEFLEAFFARFPNQKGSFHRKMF